jgi:hypothetical protein
MHPLRIVLTTSIALLSCGFCADDPYQPKLIRVWIQFIEVPHPVLTEMLAKEKPGGPAIHDKAFALSKEGTAKILETSMVMGRSGQRSTVESISEVMYPCEYDPPGWPFPDQKPPVPPPDPTPRKPFIRPDQGVGFATRNTGVTFEIEPTLNENERFIDLRFTPEVVSLVRQDIVMEHVDEWGDASLRMPVFETWRLNNTALTLVAGQFELVSVLTPKPNAPGPAALRKILVFVRADVVLVPNLL